MNFLKSFLRRQTLSYYFNFSLPRRIGKQTFWIPIMHKMGWGNYNISELWMMDIFERVLTNVQGTFIDVGANIGQTLLKLRGVTDITPYLGIEANPICFFYLNELIQKNKILFSTVIPIGAFSSSEILSLGLLFDDKVDSGASFIKSPIAKSAEKKQWAAVFPLDHIAIQMNIEAISIIKIDVEGAELEVLKGMNEILKTKRPIVLLEILPVYKKENRERMERQIKTESLLAQYQYSLFRIIKDKGNRFVSLEAVSTIGIHADITLCDYVVFPEEKTKILLNYFSGNAI